MIAHELPHEVQLFALSASPLFREAIQTNPADNGGSARGREEIVPANRHQQSDERHADPVRKVENEVAFHGYIAISSKWLK